jgi:alcohol dehydrogenase class IV
MGRGALRRLGDAARDSGPALLVSYRDAGALGETLPRAAQFLAKAGVPTVPFFEVERDPAGTLVEDGVQAAKAAGVGQVIAIGGGSAIDVAKGIAALMRMPGSLWDFTDANSSSRPVTEALPVIAVPTTAGTGSEVTSVAVFEYRGVGSQPDVPLKASLYGPALTPRVAIVDPDLTLDAPKSLTVESAADALAHAIEASVCRLANPWTSLLAAEAVARIVESLPRAVENPADPESRESLALAATWAGAAFNQSGVTIGHAMAHALGAVAKIPHAAAVALCMPASLRFNLQASIEPCSRLASKCRVERDTPETMAAGFVECIGRLLQSVGLPAQIAVPAADRSSWLDRLAAIAMECMPSAVALNPRKVGRADLIAMFEEILLS